MMDSPQTCDSPRSPDKTSRVVLWLFISAILCVGGLYAGRQLWRAAVEKELQSHIRQAREAMERRDWEGASACIRAAAQIHAENPDLMRLIVHYVDETGSDPALALQMLHQLKRTGHELPGDAILVAKAHVRAGNIQAARGIWEGLPQSDRASPEALELKARILQQEGGAGEALALQQNADMQAVNSPEGALKVALLETASVYPEVARGGLERLWLASERTDALGHTALLHLTQQRSLTLAQALEVQQRLAKHPSAGLADHLAARSLVMRLAPERRAELMDEAVRDHEKEGPEAITTLARWLAAERGVDQLSQLIPRDRLLKSKELFPVFLQALAESARWKEMGELLEGRTALPMAPEGLAVWRAVASSRLRPDLKQAEDHLALAIKFSVPSRNWGTLRAAAQVAEDLQLWSLALGAYTQLAEAGTGNELEMLEKCWGIAGRGGDSAALLDTARRQAALRPTSRLFSDRLDYLRLLRGVEIESIRSKDAGDLKLEENHDSSALLAALRAYRLGDPQLTQQELGRLRNAALLPPGQRAVCAGLLASAGERGRAFQLGEQISMQLLTPEERTFLLKAL